MRAMGLVMGPWIWMGPISLLLWILVAIAVIFVLRATGTIGRQDKSSPALEILDSRYARGEVSREEYLRMREDITGRPGPG